MENKTKGGVATMPKPQKVNNSVFHTTRPVVRMVGWCKSCDGLIDEMGHCKCSGIYQGK